MKLDDATREAAWIVSKFEHLCEKAMIVGSIRRQKPEVNDIDIVVIPHVPRNQNWDEKDIFAALGLAYIEPEDREA